MGVAQAAGAGRPAAPLSSRAWRSIPSSPSLTTRPQMQMYEHTTLHYHRVGEACLAVGYTAVHAVLQASTRVHFFFDGHAQVRGHCSRHLPCSLLLATLPLYSLEQPSHHSRRACLRGTGHAAMSQPHISSSPSPAHVLRRMPHRTPPCPRPSACAWPQPCLTSAPASPAST